MKGKAKGMKKIGFLIFLIFILTAVLSFFTFAADDSFEKSISGFPESYKPYLRELHEKYPNWKFEPLMTGLDWQEVIKNEYGEKSLVQSSVTSKTWKSLDKDDYNPDTGAFVFKDGGFVQANKFALEYFMDPRNFLTEDGIFQFELLGFSENYTIEMIERVLKGSFMSQTKIQYYSYNEKTKELTTVKTNETYSQVIYQAGRTYDINPCYLASKILNELGSDGSYSSYGNHPTYPGIYNYYNIGATDGTGAIARGLLWAKGGDTNKTTYGRPWTSPKKSIMGGAQFLAEEYIGKGQFTGYLQRFNVNPDGKYSLYTHQYMTNLTGALSQGYSTYASYASFGMLDGSITFSIPVYNNMSGVMDSSGTVTLADSYLQNGTINSSSANCVLRTGPAKSYANVKTKSGSAVSIPKGTKVKILSKNFTDSNYYLNILDAPIWFKVSVSTSSGTYEGYVDGDFIDIDTTTCVSVGDLDLTFFRTNDTLVTGLMTSDYRYCTVTDSDTVNFAKVGTVYVTLYNSSGGYDKVKYTVTTKNYTPKGMTVTASDTKAQISLTQNSKVERYGFYFQSAQGELLKGGDTTANSYTFKSLQSGTKYLVSCRYVTSYGYENGFFQTKTVITKPKKAENLSYTRSGDGKLVISWSDAGTCTGYKVFVYDKTTEEYTRIGIVDSGKNSFTVPSQYSEADCFMVRTYVQYDGVTVHGSYSDHLEVKNDETITPEDLATIKNITASEQTENSFRLSWEAVDKADGYRVYQYRSGSWKLVTETSETSQTYTDLTPGKQFKLTVKAYAYQNDQKILAKDYIPYTTATLAAVPKEITAEPQSTTKIKLTWYESSGATGYNLYYYNTAIGDWKAIRTVNTNTYTVSALKAGTTYTFAIEPFIQIGDTVLKSAFATYDATSKAAVPTEITAAPQSTTKIKLTWNAVFGATGYKLYYLNTSTNSWKAIRTITDNTYTVSALKAGTTYTFAIKPYIQIGDTVIWSSYATYDATTKAAVPTEITAAPQSTTKIKLTWNAVSGATGYKLYYLNTSTNSWKAIRTIADNTYTVSALKAGTTYTFAIKPYIQIGDTVIWSSYATYEASTKCATPVLTVTSPSKGKAVFSWNDVVGESGYEIWYCTTENGTYKKLKSYAPDTVTAERTGITSGKTYYFKVRAYKEVGGGYLYGGASAAAGVKIK